MGNRIERAQIEERAVRITEVNTSTRTVLGTDGYGSKLYISTSFHDPVMAIPAVGELWTIQRRGGDWFLDRRNDTGNEKKSYEQLQPGDRRIEGANIHLNGQVMVNGRTLESIIADAIAAAH